MEKVSVNASTNYDILIERGILDNCGTLIKECTNAKTAAVITDDNVDKLYSKAVMESLSAAGIRNVKYVFQNGEEHKSLETVSSILSFLAENELTRSDIIVALGGGIVGDVSGFCASAYLRGIKFVQIPTTLLAAVDSSVGGKTGVNLPQGKNLAGAFHQPALVICDPDCFKTLSPEIFADGISESIKYGIIADQKLFELFENGDVEKNIEQIVRQCVIIKSDIVSRDEFDTGERQKLNLGHTVGHAIEKCSNYKISHGHAVAAGMVIACKGSQKLGICADISERVEAVLTKYSLPTSTEFSVSSLVSAMLRDKKRNAENINLVLPTKIGECILYKADVSQLESIFG
ncbi:MAG: 3-dehydroquinate synthase [Clostridia bacterium]|nr:3-dehydroquinate synthase [Clostridia bacterium]